jgi:hypothetical protein
MDAFGDRFVHADCLSHTYKDAQLKYEWDLTAASRTSRSSSSNPDRVKKGAIGWGCWTAHSEYNDKEPYQEQLIGQERSSPQRPFRNPAVDPRRRRGFFFP